MSWVYDDGGRSAAGFKGEAGDCVTHAVAIATGISYQQVYHELHEQMRARQPRKRDRGTHTSPRAGVWPDVYKPYLAGLGWVWSPTMGIGTGTRVHLCAAELPPGRLVVRCSKHLTAVIDGVIHDTHDPSRDGTRAVYGYWNAS